MTGDKLRGRIEAALARPPAGARTLVVVYGGALHNDLHPVSEELVPFTFGRRVRDRVGSGRYLEVDLYVPEYVDRVPQVRRAPWFARYTRLARKGQAAVIKRAPDSFIVMLPRAGASRRR